MKRSLGLTFWLVVLHSIVANGQHIHFLLVSDTADPKIGQACVATVNNVRGSLQSLIPAQRYSLSVMESQNQRYDAESVVKAIRAVQVEQKDTFVFFYDGHGARSQGHHFLQMPGGGKLWSADLQNAVKKKQCHLKVILSGSCNVPAQRGPAAALAQQWNVQNGIAPVMEELFVNHDGLMHMNGAWPGQFGFTNNQEGNWLFAEFLNYCTLCSTGRPTWSAIDRMMDRRLGDRFQKAFGGKYVEAGTGYTQTSLKTITWSLPKDASRPSRFGVAGDDGRTRTGVTVIQVDQRSPARGILQRGDIITSINGEEVRDADSFFDLVRCSPRQMHLEFTRSGNVTSTDVTLPW